MGSRINKEEIECVKDVLNCELKKGDELITIHRNKDSQNLTINVFADSLLVIGALESIKNYLLNREREPNLQLLN